MKQNLELLLNTGVQFTITEETLCDVSPEAEALVRQAIYCHMKAGASLWIPEEVINSIFDRAEQGNPLGNLGAERIKALYDAGVLRTVLTGQNTPVSFDAILGALHELRTIPGTRYGVMTTSNHEMLRLQAIMENTPAVNGSRIICYRGEEPQTAVVKCRPQEVIPDRVHASGPAHASSPMHVSGPAYDSGSTYASQRLQQGMRREGMPYAVGKNCLTFCCFTSGRFHSLCGKITFGPREAVVRFYCPFRLDDEGQVLVGWPFARKQEAPYWQRDVYSPVPASHAMKVERQGNEVCVMTILPYRGADVTNLRHIAEAAANHFELFMGEGV